MIHTCEHLAIDTETLQWVCGASSSNPSGMNQEKVKILDIGVDGEKTQPVCKVFNVIGAKWLRRSITNNCDGASVIPAVFVDLSDDIDD